MSKKKNKEFEQFYNERRRAILAEKERRRRTEEYNPTQEQANDNR